MQLSDDHHIGLRLKRERKQKALSQKEVAESLGISPTYLNLIENGKRRVTKKLLTAFGSVLDLSTQSISDTSFSKVASYLAAKPAFENLSRAQIEKLLVEHPEWQKVLLLLTQENERLAAHMEKMRDRINSDEVLSNQLHDLLSRATSIRSTANIINTQGGLSPEIDGQFREILDRESEQLSEELRALVEHIQSQSQDSYNEASESQRLYEWMWDIAYDSPAIEGNPAPKFEKWIAPSGAKPNTRARKLFEIFARDAALAPIGKVSKYGEATDWELHEMANMLGISLDRLLRRLAVLAHRAGWGKVHMHIVDHTGFVWLDAPQSSGLPMQNLRCPIWPIFVAPSRAGDLVEGAFEIAAQRTNALAASSQWMQLSKDVPEQLTTMISFNADFSAPWAKFKDQIVITTENCIDCVRPDCQHRRLRNE